MGTLKYFDTNSGEWKYLAAGEKGDPGEGIPLGGDDNWILVKDGTDDYVTKWVDPVILADKNHVVDFSVTDEVIVNHNLNKYPAVQVMDSAGDQVEGEVYYVNTSQLIVSFNSPFSGRVTCN